MCSRRDCPGEGLWAATIDVGGGDHVSTRAFDARTPAMRAA